jgi:hypothetical protein
MLPTMLVFLNHNIRRKAIADLNPPSPSVWLMKSEGFPPVQCYQTVGLRKEDAELLDPLNARGETV